MLVLMVLVMNVHVLVLEGLVNVPVRMSFGEQ